MMQSPPSHDRLRGMLLGLAVGDATGTTLEFKPRGSFVPITEMEGGGPFGLQPGQWTDDTSMALCLADSLVSRGGFDPRDQMERYGRWRREGYWSATGSCFDIGNTVAGALRKFEQTGNPASGPTHPQSAGNGSIMRLAPVPMFYHRDPAAAIRVAGESSRTTHGASECVESCRLFAHLLLAAANADSKEMILAAMAEFRTAEARVQSIARGDFRAKPSSSIRGSGYVIDCLEAALWAFFGHTDFREAILAAANLGDDADTTAAVCGQVAGAFYGMAGIPDRWLEKLAMRDEILVLADRLLKGP